MDARSVYRLQTGFAQGQRSSYHGDNFQQMSRLAASIYTSGILKLNAPPPNRH